jgi:hypothetical protein
VAELAQVDCPNGPHPSFVRKVTSVYSEGVSTTSGGGMTSALTYDGEGFARTVGVVSMSGMSHTSLSARLRPPAGPEREYVNPFTTGVKWQIAICIILFALYFIPLIVAGIIWYKKSGVAAARHAAVEARRPAFNAALQRWDQAYYCSKCDVEFLPDGSGQGSPEEFRDRVLTY